MPTVVKAIYSDCGRYRADIERREGDVFQVVVRQWYEGYVGDYGEVPGYWAEPPSSPLTFTDTIDNAEKLATEALASFD